MKRNFFRRVETCIPILDKKIKARILQEGIRYYLKDNTNSWVMDKNGNYTRLINKNKPFSAQDTLIQTLCN